MTPISIDEPHAKTRLLPPNQVTLFIICVVLFIVFIAIACTTTPQPNDQASLDLIEELPAHVSMKFDEKLKKDRIRFFRLSPRQSDRPRNFAPLGTDLTVRWLKSFEALHCDDFGDRELALLQDANRVEHLALSGSAITDESLKLMQHKFPSLRVLEIKNCNISKKELLALLAVKKLLLLRVSPDMADPEFLEQVREVAPSLIYHCKGKDLLNQPESVTQSIPWSTWEE